MLLWLINLAFSIAFIATLLSIVKTLAQLRRDQAALVREVERIGQFLGVPVQRQLMIVCTHCGTQYQPDLTGCPHCGRAKPDHVQPELRAVEVRGHADTSNPE